MIKSVGSGFRQPGVRIKKGNPHAIFNTMRATRLPPYRIVNNGSFRLALCLGHNFYLPLVDFLLDFHSPQAIVTSPLKNSRTALLEVGQDWVGEGRE